MANKRNIYNEDKANSVFAVKIRKLFEESDNTHGKLAEYIEKETGESVTRQAVGQWCNGNSCPNLKTVPIIAKFFGVSTDYLLTNTEIKSVNENIQTACKVTGLSEKAINGLQLMSKLGYNWLFDTVNFIIEDSCAVINETLTALNITERIDKIVNVTELIESGEKGLNIENGSHLLINLMYYLNTKADESSSTIEDEIHISKSGKLIEYNSVSSPNCIKKVEDIISIKAIKKSDIVNNILYEDLCDSIKKAKQIYQNQQKAGD